MPTTNLISPNTVPKACRCGWHHVGSVRAKLLTEYHIRYGKYGGIGYYHVSDAYIALFSHFIPYGVYEAVYILDGLMSNKSDIQPDTLHGDTQAQSYPVFGLSHLLGINLMPRIRNPGLVAVQAHVLSIQKYRALFAGSIDFKLIERHLRDMLRVVISIKKGKITASTILRRLGTYSRKTSCIWLLKLGKAVEPLCSDILMNSNCENHPVCNQ